MLRRTSWLFSLLSFSLCSSSAPSLHHWAFLQTRWRVLCPPACGINLQTSDVHQFTHTCTQKHYCTCNMCKVPTCTDNKNVLALWHTSLSLQYLLSSDIVEYKSRIQYEHACLSTSMPWLPLIPFKYMPAMASRQVATVIQCWCNHWGKRLALPWRFSDK